MRRRVMVFAAPALLLPAACGDMDAGEGGTTAAAETEMVQTPTQTCTDEMMIAKTNELGEKLRGLVGQPGPLKAIQDIQQKYPMDENGSIPLEFACDALDEQLAAIG